MITVVITIVVIIILAAIFVSNSSRVPDDANYANFADEIRNVEEGVQQARLQNAYKGDTEEKINAGFKKVTLQNAPTEFQSFDTTGRTKTGYVVDLDEIGYENAKWGHSYEIATSELKFKNEDVYVYDSTGAVFYVKGIFYKEEIIHRPFSDSVNGMSSTDDGPIITSVIVGSGELADGTKTSSKAKIIVTAVPRNGGALTVMVRELIADKQPNGTFTTQVSKNGVYVIAVSEEGGGKTVTRVTVTGIIESDSTPSNLSMIVNNGNPNVTTNMVDVVVRADGADKMIIAKNNPLKPSATDSRWEDYRTNFTYDLGPEEGRITLYAWFKNEYSNVTDKIVKASIIYDRTPPSTEAPTVVIPSSKAWITTNQKDNISPDSYILQKTEYGYREHDGAYADEDDYTWSTSPATEELENGKTYDFVTRTWDEVGHKSVSQVASQRIKFDYIVSFNLNGAEGSIEDMATEAGSSIVVPIPEVTREGYSFIGWSERQDALPSDIADIIYGNNNYYPTGNEKNKTLYAVWSPRTDMSYVVQHYVEKIDSLGEYELKLSETFNDGKVGDLAWAIPKDDGDFLGFVENPYHSQRVGMAEIKGDGSTVLKLYYYRAKFDLIVKGENATTTGTKVEVPYETEVAITITPDQGYQFDKWIIDGVEEGAADYDNFVNVNGNRNPNATFKMPAKTVTLIGKTNLRKYAIIYNLNGGIPSGVNPTEYDRNTPAFTLYNPSKRGYEFVGWAGTDLIQNTLNVTVDPSKLVNMVDREYEALFTPSEDLLTITASPTTPTNGTVRAMISCLDDSLRVEYRLGNSGTWDMYASAISINENTVIYARAIKDGVVVDEESLAINNIDKEAPVIRDINISENWKAGNKLIVDVTATDNVQIYGYAITSSETEPTKDEFTTSNKELKLNQEVNYVWVRDVAGNVVSQIVYAWDISKNSDKKIYALLKNESELVIDGTGETASYELETVPYRTYKELVETIEVNGDVEVIGSHVLSSMENAREISISKSVEELKENAIVRTNNYETINLESGNKNFVYENYTLYDYDKTEVYVHSRIDPTTEYTIPSTVDTITNYAFYENDNLSSIVVNSNPVLEENVFENCSELYQIDGEIGGTLIGKEAFVDCTNLHILDISDSLIEIDEGAFRNTTKLGVIEIPKTVTTVVNASTSQNGVFEQIGIDSKNIYNQGVVRYYQSCEAMYDYAHKYSTEAHFEMIDDIPPEIISLEITSPETGTYAQEDEIVFTAKFSEDLAIVSETPLPVLKIKIGEGMEKVVSTSILSGDEIRYLYSVQPDDAGKLGLVSYKGRVYDLTENPADIEITELGGSEIYIDTVAQLVEGDVVTYHTSLQKAIDAMTTLNASIILLKDTDESITIGANKTVVINLNSNELSNTSSNPAITNNGTLQIFDGTINSVTTAVITKENSSLTIANIQMEITGANQTGIVSESLSNVTILESEISGKALLIDNRGTLYLGIIDLTTENGPVVKMNSGTTGDILECNLSTDNGYGINIIDSATLNINDSTIESETGTAINNAGTVSISGNTIIKGANGINSTGDVEIYDATIEGTDAERAAVENLGNFEIYYGKIQSSVGTAVRNSAGNFVSVRTNIKTTGTGKEAIRNANGATLEITSGDIYSKESYALSNYGTATITQNTSLHSDAVAIFNLGTYTDTNSNIISKGYVGIENRASVTLNGTTINVTNSNGDAIGIRLNEDSEATLLETTIIATSTNGIGYGVYNDRGTLTVGVENETLETNLPLIDGSTYGYYSEEGTLNYYDGRFFGEEDQSIEGTITDIPDDSYVIYTLTEGREYSMLTYDIWPPTNVTLVADKTEWTNETIVLTGTAKDEGTGIGYYVINTSSSMPSDEEWIEVTPPVKDFTITKDIQEYGIYYLHVMDAMKNYVISNPVEAKYDAEAPEITDVVTSTTWSSGSTLKLDVIATDNKASVLSYAVTATSDSTSASWNNSSTVTILGEENYIHVKDEAGNVTTVLVKAWDVSKNTDKTVYVYLKESGELVATGEGETKDYSEGGAVTTIGNQIASVVKVGDYVEYESDNVYDGTWRVFDIVDGKVLITNAESTGDIVYINNIGDFTPIEEKCDQFICSGLGIGEEDIRSMTIDDIYKAIGIVPEVESRTVWYSADDPTFTEGTIEYNGNSYQKIRHTSRLLNGFTEPRIYEWDFAENISGDNNGVLYAYPTEGKPVYITTYKKFDYDLNLYPHVKNSNITVGNLLASPKHGFMASGTTFYYASYGEIYYSVYKLESGKIIATGISNSYTLNDAYFTSDYNPIVSLDSNIQATRADESSPWKLSLGETNETTVTKIDVPWQADIPNITKLTIEEGVTHAGEYIFSHLENATEVSIPSTLGRGIDIATSAFAATNNFENITIANGNTALKLDGEYTLVDDESKILYLHNRRDTATTYTINSNIEVIAEGAFYKNSNLETVEMQSKVDIKDSAFEGCSNLESINGEIGNTTLGDRAFHGTTKLTNITISKTVTTLGGNEIFTNIGIDAGTDTGKGYVYYYDSCTAMANYTQNEETKNQATFIGIDDIAPVVSSVVINDGAVITNNKELNVKVTATDNREVTGIFITTDSSINPKTQTVSWLAPAEEYTYTLPEESNDCTLYVWAKDAAGNISENPGVDGIILSIYKFELNSDIDIIQYVDTTGKDYYEYRESGYTLDNSNIDVEITGSVNHKLAGDYNIDYKISFEGQEIETVTKTVHVIKNEWDTSVSSDSVVNKVKIGDYVNYSANGMTKWRVFDIVNGEVLIIPENGNTVDGWSYEGVDGYINGINYIEEKCDRYVNSSLEITENDVRSLTLEDINNATGYIPNEPERYAYYVNGDATYTEETVVYDGKEYIPKVHTSDIISSSDWEELRFYKWDYAENISGDKNGNLYAYPTEGKPVYLTTNRYSYNPSEYNHVRNTDITVGSLLGTEVWLASTGSYHDEFSWMKYAAFTIFYAKDTKVGSTALVDTTGTESLAWMYFCPVVSLGTNIKATRANETAAWNLSLEDTNVVNNTIITDGNFEFVIHATEPYAKIVGYTNTSNETTLTIPETLTYNGAEYKVIDIGNETTAIASDDVVQKVVLGNNIIAVSDYAFSQFTKLSEIEYSENLMTIGAYAFANSNGTYSKVTINDNVREVKFAAFENTIVNEIEIEEGVKSVEDKAFYTTKGIFNDKTLNIPSTVDYIGVGAFAGYKVNSITVNSANAKYASVDNTILTDKAQTVIYQYAIGKEETEYTIPAGITGIAGYAFTEAENLQKVVLNTEVTAIGEKAFKNTKLQNIYIPNNVTLIAKEAFANNADLEYVVIDAKPTIAGDVFKTSNNFKYLIALDENTKITLNEELELPTSTILYVTSENIETAYESDSKWSVLGADRIKCLAELIGDEEVSTVDKEIYTELGVKVLEENFPTAIGTSSIVPEITVDHITNLNDEIAGVYDIVYAIRYNGNIEMTLVRTVNVIDDTAPVISDIVTSTTWTKGSMLKLDVIATDNKDDVVSYAITVSEDSTSATWSNNSTVTIVGEENYIHVKDKAGNVTTALVKAWDVSENTDMTVYTYLKESGELVATGEGETKDYEIEKTVEMSNDSLLAQAKVGDYVNYSANGVNSWRVFDIQDGKVMIIPSKGIGINAAIKNVSDLSNIENACDTYINSNLGIASDDVRNMTVEDVNNITGYTPTTGRRKAFYLYNDTTFTNGTIEYDGNEYTKIMHNNSLYYGWTEPRFYIWDYAENISGDENGNLYAYPTEGKPVYITESWYQYELDSYKHVKNDTISVSDLLGSNSKGWLTSTSLTFNERYAVGYVSFNMRLVSNNKVNSISMTLSEGNDFITSTYNPVRPVVLLGSNIQATRANETSPWELSLVETNNITTTKLDVPWQADIPNITKLTIEEGMTHAGEYIFSYLENATEVSIPSTLGNGGDIATSAFAGTNNFTNITIANGNTALKQEGAYTIVDDESKIIYIHNRRDPATTYTINSNIEKIAEGAFYKNNNLKTVEMNVLAEIGASAFENCLNLETINGEIGNTSIGSSAFAGDINLEGIYISTTVTNLGTGIFTDVPGPVYYYASCPAMKEYESTYPDETWYIMIDNVDPTDTKPTLKASSSTIMATSNQVDEDSAIVKVEYIIRADGEEYDETKWQSSQYFTQLTATTKYFVKTRVEDEEGNKATSQEASITTQEVPTAINILAVPATPTSGDVDVVVEWPVIAMEELYGSTWSGEATVTKQIGIQNPGNTTTSWSDINDENATYIHTATENGVIVYARLFDGTNTSQTISLSVGNIDRIAPTGSVVVNNGDEDVLGNAVTLSLSAIDDRNDTGFGVKYYSASESSTLDLATAEWRAYTGAGEYEFDFTGETDEKTVYVWYMDAAGNISDVCSDSIYVITYNIKLEQNGETTYYNELQTAINSVNDNAAIASKITLLNNIAQEGTYTVSKAKNILLEMNGKDISYTAENGFTLITNKGLLTIMNSRNHESGIYAISNTGTAIGIVNHGYLEIIDVSVSADSPDGTSVGIMNEGIEPTYEGATLSKTKFKRFAGNDTTKSIVFTDTGATKGTDVSEENNGSILAWMDDTTCYVSAKEAGYKILMPQYSDSFFSGTGFENIEKIECEHLDTSNVTSMMRMFQGTGENATTFKVSGLNGWDLSSLTDMRWMFWSAGENATTFELSGLSEWDVSNVINMWYMFENAGPNATTWSIGDLSRWNVSNVVNMKGMFLAAGENATTFNIGDLSGWNVSNVKYIDRMFDTAGRNATTWSIGDLSEWNVSNVTNMNSMFANAGANATTWSIGDLNDWNVSNVTNMDSMFANAGANATTWSIGDLNDWNVSNVTNMYSMFWFAGTKATTFDIGNLSKWNVSSVTTMSYMFSKAGYKATTWSIGDLSSWDVSSVTTMRYMFEMAGEEATTFDIGDLSKWNVSNVIDMNSMFANAGEGATTWSIGDLSRWNVSNVTDMGSMFNCGNEMKATTWSIGDLSKWNVSNVTNMSSMFFGAGKNATTFDIGDLSEWNVSNVTKMDNMFTNTGLNATTWSIGDLSEWNVSNVTDMSSMFSSAGAEATTWSIGDLSEWNVSNVTDMGYMFYRAGESVETWSIGDLSRWNVSNVTDMSSMFNFTFGSKATTFDIGDLSDWNISNVTNMEKMFYRCSIKGLDLSNWDTSNVTTMKYMFSGCNLLEKVTLGTGFKFVGTDGYLPTPNSSHITGATGLWYDISTGEGYVPANVHQNATTTVTYVAVYEPYTITYNLNGGTLTSDNPTTYTKYSPDITLGTPTREGYTFVGWTGSNGTVAQTTVTIPTGSTGNKEYSANWLANTYYVRYNANEGTGTMSNSTHVYGMPTSLTANTFTRTGYDFKGWATTAGGSVVYADKAAVSTLTAENGGIADLYAVWEVVTYEVIIDCNGGSGVSNTSYTIETESFTLGTPTRADYSFTGWTGSNGTTPQTSVIISKGTTGNLNYTANWEATNVYIYKDGDEYEDVTGGWYTAGWDGGGDGDGTTTYSSSSIDIYCYNNSSGGIQIQGATTNNKIDLGNVKKIYARGRMTNAASESYHIPNNAIGIAVMNSDEFTWSGTTSTPGVVVTCDYVNEIGDFNIELDVSNLNGSYYIAIYGFANSRHVAGSFSQIILEMK